MSGLISTTTAPAWRAKWGSDAAGSTTADVPMLKNTWAFWAACMACSIASAGRFSPNQTTSGRSRPPQLGHLGGISPPAAQVSITSPCSEHLVRRMLPCSSITWGLPARWCRPSTFWVMRVKWGNLAAICARAKCPALGETAFTRPRRQVYHSHTSRGLRRKACGVASSVGSYCAHSPVCASRKVGMPLSLETPAPVSTTMRGCWRRVLSSWGEKFIGSF